MPLKTDAGQNCPFNRVLRTGSQRPRCEGWGRWLMSHDGGNVWHIIQTIKASENLSSSQHVSQIKWMTSVCFRSFFPPSLWCVCVCVCARSQFFNRRFGPRSVIYSNKIQAENHSKKTVSDGSMTTEPYVENSSTVKKVWKKKQLYLGWLHIAPLFKTGNEFYTSWLCFLIIITPRVEPCFLYQRQLGERVSTARCQARWWMVLLNLLRRCCIIVCHCSKSSYLLGQGCHRHHIASTPDFSPPLCGLSPPLSAPPSVFPIAPVASVPWRFFYLFFFRRK